MRTIDEQEMNIQKLSEKCCEQEKLAIDSIELKKKLKELEAEFDLQKAQMELTKDFTVKVGLVEIKVHKAVLAAHSPVLAHLISKIPRGNHLELDDISASAFQQIVHFMYTENVPENVDLIELYAASGRFGMMVFCGIIVDKIYESINENPIDILISCNEHGHDKFKMQAFKKLWTIHSKRIKQFLLRELLNIQWKLKEDILFK